MAGTTGFEPATFDVTGRRSNQLSYVPAAITLSPSQNNTRRRSLLRGSLTGTAVISTAAAQPENQQRDQHHHQNNPKILHKPHLGNAAASIPGTIFNAFL